MGSLRPCMTLPLGSNQYTAGSANLPTQSQAAELLSVSERSVRAATKVKNEGAPELADAVEQGKVSVSAAARYIEIRIGELLGSGKPGPQESSLASEDFNIPKVDRHKFRVGRMVV